MNEQLEQFAARRRWPPLPQALAWAGFLSLNVTGGWYALQTLALVWKLRLLVRLLADRNLFFNLLHLSWLVIPVGLALVALLATIAAGRTLWRWRQHRPEPDVGVRMRALAYVALGCVAFNALILSTPLAFVGPFRLKFLIYAQISVAFAYGGYAMWSFLLPWLRRFLPARLRRGLDLLAMNVALTLVLGEISVRILAAFWPSPLLVTSSTPSQIRRDAGREAPGTLRFGFPTNQGGHYDTEFVARSGSSNRRVVSIGDSFSYGVVPHAYHFTTVTERELTGVEVYNMGYPGTSPSDYLYLLEHDALPLQPDLVVIQLFVGNDLDENPEPAGPPRWHDGDSYLLAIVWFRLRLMNRAELAGAPEAGRASSLTEDELTDAYPWLRDPSLEDPSLGREVYLQLETRNALSICTAHEGLYQRFFEGLAALKHVAGRVPLAFVLIPDEFQVEDDLWEEVVRRSAQQLDRDLAQRTVVKWLEARGWPLLDLLPLLRAVEPMSDGRRHLYHLQNTHFNARGNEVAGRALARFADSLLNTDLTPQGRAASRSVARPAPSAVTLPFHLDIGDSTARRWMQSGWQEDEVSGGQSFVWSNSLRSILEVPLPPGGAIRMDFEVLPFVFRRSPQQRVTIILNGTVIQEVRLRPGLQKYSVILPAEALRGPLDTLEFRYAYARVPSDVIRNSADERQLAVAWYSIELSALNR